jgi:hypothetical protein
MLLSELHTTAKTLKSWRETSHEDRFKIISDYCKGKSANNPVSGEELERRFKSKGITVSRRAIDKEMEKKEYRPFDKCRAKGTNPATLLKNKKVTEAKCEPCAKTKRLQGELDDLEAHKRMLKGDHTQVKARKELDDKIYYVKKELKALKQ